MSCPVCGYNSRFLSFRGTCTQECARTQYLKNVSTVTGTKDIQLLVEVARYFKDYGCAEPDLLAQIEAAVY